jgi:hypothetical protein
MPQPPVQLLGADLPITVEEGADGVVDQVLPVIQNAAAVLNTQFAAGQLTPLAISYIRALRGLGVALHRGFTPCAGTQDQGDGEYVFYIGAEDVAVNDDALWYASTIIHDGGHAWLSQQGQLATGVAVEEALIQVQIDYYNAIGGRPTYITDLADYMNDPAAIQARISEAV